MFDVVISVLFHENIETVFDYFKNLEKCFKGYKYLILISCTKSINDGLFTSEYTKIVTVRPDDYNVWGNVGLFEQHLRNYIYLRDNKIEYKRFLFSASNDLFVKKIDDYFFDKYTLGDENGNFVVSKENNKKYDKTQFEKLKTSPNRFLANFANDKNTINTFINNEISFKWNEIEGVMLSKDLLTECMEFYKRNIFGRYSNVGYFMEEFFISSYIYSKYQIDYNTPTLREKWPKEKKDIYCIKLKDRDYYNPKRVEMRDKNF